MARTPLVAVTIGRGLWNQNGVPVHYLAEAYTHAITDSGMMPVLVPSTVGQDALRNIYERVDGIILTGGGDMHPSYCGLDAGSEDARLATGIDEPRDKVEVNLVRWAYDDDKPIFGICRGHQVMNVALGGTLIIDIPSSVGKNVTHQVDNSIKWRRELLHEVEVSSNTRLAGIVGKGKLPVNSIHHQAVRDLADKLQPTAHAPDGILEAFEAPSARFFLGVQWHPEELYDTHPKMRVLFHSFAGALM